MTTLLIESDAISNKKLEVEGFIAMLLNVISTISVGTDREYRETACNCLHEIECMYPGILSAPDIPLSNNIIHYSHYQDINNNTKDINNSNNNSNSSSNNNSNIVSPNNMNIVSPNMQSSHNSSSNVSPIHSATSSISSFSHLQGGTIGHLYEYCQKEATHAVQSYLLLFSTILYHRSILVISIYSYIIIQYSYILISLYKLNLSNTNIYIDTEERNEKYEFISDRLCV